MHPSVCVASVCGQCVNAPNINFMCVEPVQAYRVLNFREASFFNSARLQLLVFHWACTCVALWNMVCVGAQLLANILKEADLKWHDYGETCVCTIACYILNNAVLCTNAFAYYAWFIFISAVSIVPIKLDHREMVSRGKRNVEHKITNQICPLKGKRISDNNVKIQTYIIIEKSITEPNVKSVF